MDRSVVIPLSAGQRQLLTTLASQRDALSRRIDDLVSMVVFGTYLPDQVAGVAEITEAGIVITLKE